MQGENNLKGSEAKRAANLAALRETVATEKPCARCGEPTVDRSINQVKKFCGACLPEARLEFNRTYQKKHADRIAGARKKYREECDAASSREAHCVAGMPHVPPMVEATRFRIPFFKELSKNRFLRRGWRGGVYIPDDTRKAFDYSLALARDALKDFRLRGKPGKVWVALMVQKPNMKSDAINMVDAVCDILKDALEIDDCWFSLKYVDWEIKRVNPEILVEVSVSRTTETRLCNRCWGEKDVAEFTKAGLLCGGCKRKGGKPLKI